MMHVYRLTFDNTDCYDTVNWKLIHDTSMYIFKMERRGKFSLIRWLFDRDIWKLDLEREKPYIKIIKE